MLKIFNFVYSCLKYNVKSNADSEAISGRLANKFFWQHSFHSYRIFAHR